YVTRANGPRTPAVEAARDPASDDAVIGRFAYTVYDLSGLLDANAAGYPQAVPATEAGLKSSSGYADLSLVGASGLADWRNPATGSGADAATFLEWSAGIARPSSAGATNAAALASAQSGHLATTSVDRAFLSRRDLLRLLASKGLSSAAPYLTHFSRTVNASSWSPTADSSNGYTYAASADAATLNGIANPNRDIPNLRFSAAASSMVHYRDDGTTETYAVLPGDASVSRRFSLARLAWVTYAGVKPGIPAAAVRSCFGLDWDAANEQWTYSEATAAGAIKTLDAVAAEGREPNFFEVLKAGILLGSTGRGTDRATTVDTASVDLDKNADLQVMRIGANIIDASDSDNYPTTILFPVGASKVPVHGVEDLPYLYHLLAPVYRIATNSGTIYTTQNMALVVIPELFNPHAASSPTGTPGSLRIRIANASFNFIAQSGKGYGSPLYFAWGVTSQPTSDPAIVFTPQPNSFRDGVGPVLTANSPTSMYTQLPWISSADTFHGFVIHNYTAFGPGDTYDTAAAGGVGVLRATMNANGDLMVVLEYQSASGQWHVYDAFCGSEALASTTGLRNATAPYIEFDPTLPLLTQTSFAPSNSAGSGGGIMSRIDPRTARYGIARGERYLTAATAPIPPASATATPYYFGLRYTLPFGASGQVLGAAPAQGVFPGLWAQGTKQGWTDTPTTGNVADNDGVVRPADGWAMSTAAASTAGAANLFQ
ncbi:MAG TPA: hypothetical protein VIM58_04360, partial [Candidatus Methylacidiphilales bacterium]